VDNYANTASRGLGPSRPPTWPTTELATARNAIGPDRALSAGQGAYAGIIESRVSKAAVEALQQSGTISAPRTWPWFAGGGSYGAFVLPRGSAIDLFNKDMGF
jgi:hypothetical protein